MFALAAALTLVWWSPASAQEDCRDMRSGKPVNCAAPLSVSPQTYAELHDQPVPHDGGSNSSGGLSAFAIAGIAIGAVVLLGGALVATRARRWRLREAAR